MKKILWSLALCVALWLGGLVWFAAKIPQPPAPDLPNADAIVVLTGGAGRIEYGLTLLAQGKGKALFVSGVNWKITPADVLRHAPPGVREQLGKLPPGSIALGHRAVNTIGNAEETARWLEENHDQSILLVTSAYHMPRALSEFYATLPGITITPAPLFDEKLILIREYNKYLAGQLRHWWMSEEQNP